MEEQMLRSPALASAVACDGYAVPASGRRKEEKDGLGW